MDLDVLKLLISGGTPAVLLGVIVVWFGKSYLPELHRQHQTTVERLLNAHTESSRAMADAVDRLGRSCRTRSKVSLVELLIEQGLSPDEAKHKAKEIIANGGDGAQA